MPHYCLTKFMLDDVIGVYSALCEYLNHFTSLYFTSLDTEAHVTREEPTQQECLFMPSISPLITCETLHCCAPSNISTQRADERTNQPTILRTPVSMTEFQTLSRASSAYLNSPKIASAFRWITLLDYGYVEDLCGDPFCLLLLYPSSRLYNACIVTHTSRVWINRVRLPILLVIS